MNDTLPISYWFDDWEPPLPVEVDAKVQRTGSQVRIEVPGHAFTFTVEFDLNALAQRDQG